MNRSVALAPAIVILELGGNDNPRALTSTQTSFPADTASR